MRINKSVAISFGISLIGSTLGHPTNPEEVTVYEYICPTDGIVTQTTHPTSVVTIDYPSSVVKVGYHSSLAAYAPPLVTSTAPAYSPVAAPTATLTPSVPQGHDIYDVKHLSPSDGAHLYYTEGGTDPGIFHIPA
jgi:hypothetical protein